MKQFSLDEYLKNPERKIVTRDGRNVKIICTNYNNSDHPIIARIDGLKYAESFSIEGKYYINERDSQLDLFFATEKHEGWVNVFDGVVGVSYAGTNIYKSKEEAEKNGKKCKNYIATVRIEW